MELNMKKSGNITINGRSFRGKSVSIINGKVSIDGVKQEGNLIDDINVVVHGDVDTLENDCGTVTANNVRTVSTQSGDIHCTDIAGSASTMSGDIECGDIGGSASTVSGDIRRG